MPELPEVEVVRRGIHSWATQREISGVEVLHPRAVRRQVDELAGELVGQTFRCASRRGKYLWLPMVDEPMALIVHLGMSGQLLMQPAYQGLAIFMPTKLSGEPKSTERRRQAVFPRPNSSACLTRQPTS